MSLLRKSALNPQTLFGANLVRWYLEQYSAGVWVDEAGNQNSNPSSGFAPPAVTIGGRKYLSFDGLNHALQIGGNAELITTALTVGFVARMANDPAAGSSVVVGRYSSGISWAVMGSSVNNRLGVTKDLGTWAETTTALNDTVLRTFVFTMGAGGSAARLNGAVEGTSGNTSAATSSSSLSIGCAMAADGVTVSDFWSGEIGNLFIAKRKASDAECASLHRYLASWARI